MPQSTMFIGVSGPSGSGKSLLAQTIVKELGSDQVVVISEDSYYKDNPELSFDERELINYDHPNSMDHELLYDHLCKLQRGETVEVPVYDHSQHQRTDRTVTVGNHKIVVFEGILLFVNPKIRDIMNIRIFMDTELDICLLRRLQRDISERGRSVESVLQQYHATVRPMCLEFIIPSKLHADIIVPKGGENRIAIDLIKSVMQDQLESTQSEEETECNPLETNTP